MRKIIDEKGRLFGRVSVIDIIVIIIAVVLVFAVYAKFHSNERISTMKNTDTVTYVFSVKGVREGIPDAIRVGDSFYDEENDVCLGKIVDMQTSDAVRVVQKTDGTQAEGPVEGRYDVLFTVEAECQIMNGRYYAGRTDEINVNSEKKIYTRYAKFTGEIVEIK